MMNPHSRTIHHHNIHTPWQELWRQLLAALIRMPWPLFFASMALIYLAEFALFSLILGFDTMHLEGDAPMDIPKPIATASQYWT